MNTKKLAVVLFNLGGPDCLDAVRPFLFNLFKDPAITSAPEPLRTMFAGLISTLRSPHSRQNYSKIGGASPILEQTQAQAKHIETALKNRNVQAQCFVAMRYWHPYVHETAKAVSLWKPDQTMLLPLYPQFSTTTTGSSLKAWQRAGGGETQAICCYPTLPGLAEAHATQIVSSWEKIQQPDNIRILFSAHGLPEKIIARGDPYQWQIEQSVSAIMKIIRNTMPKADHQLCYQSRVGPLKWTGPSLQTAITSAIQHNKTMLLCPISFVSEHVETLVELDQEYRELAQTMGGEYHRVPALSLSETFIQALADIIVKTIGRPTGIRSFTGRRLCPVSCRQCPVQPDV